MLLPAAATAYYAWEKNKEAKEVNKEDIDEEVIIEKGDFEICLSIDGENYAIPQLGTGVSQILPILIMCLTAPPDSTIIIQEPEQALHPKMQSRLADFFIAMALSGRQCIIETHSEYFIGKLRNRIAWPDNYKPGPLHKLTKLYFVTKNDGISYFKNIDIDEYAALDDWPENFFDETHKLISGMVDMLAEKEELDQEND